MSLFDLLANIPREVDYAFSLGELYLLTSILLLFEVFVLSFIILTYKKIIAGRRKSYEIVLLYFFGGIGGFLFAANLSRGAP